MPVYSAKKQRTKMWDRRVGVDGLNSHLQIREKVVSLPQGHIVDWQGARYTQSPRQPQNTSYTQRKISIKIKSTQTHCQLPMARLSNNLHKKDVVTVPPRNETSEKKIQTNAKQRFYLMNI